MFDTGIVTCPHCNETTEEQTKSFNCILEYFDLDNEIDSYIVSHFSGEWKCEHCKEFFYIKNPMPKLLKAEVTKEKPDETS